MSDNAFGKNMEEGIRGWELPRTRIKALVAGLYLVATPIGNLRDISVRALDVLAAADVVYCEDTRISGKLLAAYGIKARLAIYNDHSDARVREQIVERIRGGEVVVLISDAGMPLISDPGYKLVRDVRDEGVFVTSVPGASAPLVALQVSGIASDRFSFIGFLPSKAGARLALLEKWRDVPGSLLAFEAAPRLLAALAAVEQVMGAREVIVVRELTKMYEEVRRGTPLELIAHYKVNGLPKGEIVLVISQGEALVYSDTDIQAMLRDALKNSSTKDAAAFVAEQSGRAKKDLYDMALKIARGDS